MKNNQSINNAIDSLSQVSRDLAIAVMEIKNAIIELPEAEQTKEPMEDEFMFKFTREQMVAFMRKLNGDYCEKIDEMVTDISIDTDDCYEIDWEFSGNTAEAVVSIDEDNIREQIAGCMEMDLPSDDDLIETAVRYAEQTSAEVIK